MKIIIDDKIPFIQGVFEPWAEVVYAPGDAITADLVRDAEVLIIRTRTRCDASLLAGTRVRMIATATIGYDHIDTGYCIRNGIRVATAAGCNARGVAQWVCAALLVMGVRPQQGRVLGIVGVGNVGRAVRDVARGAGFEVLCCDPPRVLRGEPGTEDFVSQDELLARADIVTTHVLLDGTTRGLASSRFFDKAKPGIVFLNSSRGEVVDEAALKKSIQSGQVSRAALDVWANEPKIDRELLGLATVATPHVAGYSLQGKAMGTALSVRSVAQYLGLSISMDWYPAGVAGQDLRADISWAEIVAGMPSHYDIMADDAALRGAPERFETLRGSYRFRTEFF